MNSEYTVKRLLDELTEMQKEINCDGGTHVASHRGLSYIGFSVESERGEDLDYEMELESIEPTRRPGCGCADGVRFRLQKTMHSPHRMRERFLVRFGAYIYEAGHRTLEREFETLKEAQAFSERIQAAYRENATPAFLDQEFGLSGHYEFAYPYPEPELIRRTEERLD